MKPLGNRIIVEALESENESLIEIPKNASHPDKLLRGVVLSKGNKVGDKLHVGDIVVFDKMYGQRLQDNDNQRILDVGCLLAVEAPMAS